ncbi:MAG: helix-turn-helix domain-containing protein [Dermatophilaceae bacterium]
MDPRIRRTEAAVLAAAKDLFERQGYAATTMSQIAAQADCAQRTLFLRFRTKADLLMRVVDQTFMGPPEAAAALAGRRARMTTGATLDERLRSFADGAADALVRTGPMFAVAREAEASEPAIRAAFDTARHDTLANSRRLWRHLADDGLLHPDVDVAWVADTAALLASADTYLLMKTTLGWTRDELADWLHRTWTHLATTPSTT